MIRTGSSDAYAWAVQPNASIPSRKGDSPTRTSIAVEVGARIPNNTSNFSHVIGGHVDQRDSDLAGELVVWEYKEELISPEIWVVRKSDDSVTHVWEAESKFSQDRFSENPIITTMQNGKSIAEPSGSSVQMLPISSAVIASIETDITNASAPAWIADTKYNDFTDTDKLQQFLWIEEQGRRGLLVYESTTALTVGYIPPDELELRKLLWLRQASRIIHDHFGQTCVPLIESKMNVDSDGTPSV